MTLAILGQVCAAKSIQKPTIDALACRPDEGGFLFVVERDDGLSRISGL
jgi:hypothetical protein